MNDFTGMTNPTYSNAPGAVYEEIKMEPNLSYKSAGSKATTAYAEIILPKLLQRMLKYHCNLKNLKLPSKQSKIKLIMNMMIL